MTRLPKEHRASLSHSEKVYVKGKFLYYQDQKFYIKGVTYGTFSPTADGSQFPEPSIVEKDFAAMAGCGINCVRTYTIPPVYLLDLALKNNIKLMIGLPWEQHITFLDDAAKVKELQKRVKMGVEACKAHQAIFCFAIGNEIPATIVRWHGKKKIEKFLCQLYQAVKAVDEHTLVTYVNFPTTEYLDLSFLDFDCFNVYLETAEKLTAYILRLHNLVGDRPLVLAEIGLDSLRNGQEKQAETLSWQIETVFARGCAGMFVFAWTDEWWRGGLEIEDWDFGLVDRARKPKPALKAVSEAMATVPLRTYKKLPFISIIVCSFNGSATIRDTMEGILNLDYPSFEVLVVNDGSTDNLEQIVSEYPVKLINTQNNGLSSARNTGLQNAQGEIVAYIDDDAYPDRHWLQYIAFAFLSSDHAAIGGPNIAPPEDGSIAKCIANSPGGPVHVLVDDELAEHIPGCNMAFYRSALLEIGGFDPIFRSAGDDVDVCWRIQQSGKTIGFHPSALVWHHRRNSIKSYWKQQKGYGKAEALLETKWPEKYNEFGHLAWEGKIYGSGSTLPINVRKGRIFYGTWGSSLFQSIYEPANGFLSAIPLMPEWYLFSGILLTLSLSGFYYKPLLWVWAVFFTSVLIVLIQAVISANRNVSIAARHYTFKYKMVIIFLHIIQPMARLYGRLKHGLRPWTKINAVSNHKFAFVSSSQLNHWSEKWRPVEDYLRDIETRLIRLKARVKRGGSFDRWDLQARNSLLSVSRGLITVEDHGVNRQMVKFRIWSGMSKVGGIIMCGLFVLLILMLVIQLKPIAWGLAATIILLLAEYFKDSASTMYKLYESFLSLSEQKRPQTLATPVSSPDHDELVGPEAVHI